MNIARQKSKSVDAKNVEFSLISSSISRSSIRISFDREWSTSHVRWELEYIWSAITSNQVVVFAYHRHMQFQLRSHSFEISYKIALRYVSMRTVLSAFKAIEFEIFRSTHARENLSRHFSIPVHFSIHVSRFSKVSHSTSICRRCQGHSVICLSSRWSTSIASRTESSEIFMKIFTLRKRWSEEVTKVVCFRTSHYWFLFGKVTISRKF